MEVNNTLSKKRLNRKVYGYSVASLIELMVSLLDTYAKLMKLRCSDELIEVIFELFFNVFLLSTDHRGR